MINSGHLKDNQERRDGKETGGRAGSYDQLGVCAEYPLKNEAGFTVDKNVPAGNIALDKIDGNTVCVHQELRDTSTP